MLHLIALALIVAMVLLGRWQLAVSNHKHFSLQNFGYALQWWAFSLFVLTMWARILLDRGRHPGATEAGETYRAARVPDPQPAAQPGRPIAYRRYVMPQSSSAQAPATDPEHAAYNDYLARLDAASPAPSRTEGTTP